MPLRPRVIRRPDPTTPEGIIDRAREDAEAAMAGAMGETDAMREFARQEGYAQGRAEAAAEVTDALASLRAMARGLAEQREVIEESAVREATALAVEVAARLVRADVAANTDRVADAIERASGLSDAVVEAPPQQVLPPTPPPPAPPSPATAPTAPPA